jgi:spermidine/putrescine transport system substrate-binding protein
LLGFAISILLGVGVGLQIKKSRERSNQQATDHLATVKVLALKGLFSSELLARFKAQTSFDVMITEADNPEDLWDKLEAPAPASGPYDLVVLFSYQVALATQLTRIQPIDPQKLKGFDATSPDFRELPGEKGFHSVVPLLWGATGLLYDTKKTSAPDSWAATFKDPRFKGKIGFPAWSSEIVRLLNITSETKDLKRALAPFLSNVKLATDDLSPASLFKPNDSPWIVLASYGETAFAPLNNQQWKFIIPQEKSSLWVLSLGVTRDSQNTNESSRFLEFLLEKDSAIALSQSYRQASTNRLVEASPIDPRLKPSYLRQLPLTKISLFKDFSRAREVRKLLN